ncbi:sigma-70 family RNA polymerase sigma factor [Pontibacterium granulatum]|uniref:sigma-70 family RNA polymerase sigma factor n=1 Tax=Pontibacterium granulatum TaxID=2036029 RepID=UPI00249A6F00|nr:sigma-70 family RNA polymerase sigma factor [Pontibacterium granulatum]MDI3324115.1 sigma-70 family RNA polymerase sigma factor [Pontibacterium granulatum]
MEDKENRTPGDDVEKVVAISRDPSASREWTARLAHFAETREKASYIQLFRHFAPKVKAYIIRLGLTEATAEELMQETMLAVWNKAHLYNSSKAAASTWIFTLARNQSIDWMRRQKYPEYELEDWHVGEDEGDAGEQSVLSDRMAEAMKTLPENQAQVIYMSFFEGRSHQEIADRIGIPLGSVKSRIRLAADKLKSVWRVDV